jgi:hypothetical protein
MFVKNVKFFGILNIIESYKKKIRFINEWIFRYELI